MVNILVTQVILRGRGGPYASVPISITLASLAGMGDMRYYIEVSVKSGQGIESNRLIEIMLLGEANDFIQYYDVDCACEE